MTTAQKFKQFTGLNYAEQAKSFLNAYWNELMEETENVWSWTHQFIELDHERQKDGNDLDEFNAHRFLERNGETRTVKQMRDELRAIDMDFNKRMALVEFLCFHYRKSIEDFVSRPQGDNTEEINEAQRQLEEAQRALQAAQDAVVASDEAAAQAATSARVAEQDAQTAASNAEAAANAEAELKLALDALLREEQKYSDTTTQLTNRSQDQNIGVVTRNKAANELAQHLAQDTLPLRQAKITTQAATKKAEKTKLAAIESAELAHTSSVEAKSFAEEAERKVDEAKEKAVEAENLCAEAERFLEDVRSRPGGGQGALWWIDRELQEVKKYLPKRKQ